MAFCFILQQISVDVESRWCLEHWSSSGWSVDTHWTPAEYRQKCRCRTNFSLALWHLHMIFQHHIALITPAAAVYGRARYISFHYLRFAVWPCRVYFFINAGMSDCPEWIKITPMPESVQYRDMRTQSGTGMLRYRTEIQDARMSMQAASASMPVPSYGFFWYGCYIINSLIPDSFSTSLPPKSQKRHTSFLCIFTPPPRPSTAWAGFQNKCLSFWETSTVVTLKSGLIWRESVINWGI